MCAQTEQSVASAARAARQGAETPDRLAEGRWSWVEPSVWTERMLTALEQGVKGGKWFSLIDKVHRRSNLAASFSKVSRNKGSAGVDHVTVSAFARQLEANLEGLEAGLRDGMYHPQSVKRVYIPKPGSDKKRPLGIPTVRDRVAQGALRHALEPIFERDFAEGSYGFRPGRSCKDALRQVAQGLQAGRTWIVDADIQSYFDEIPHDRLIARIKDKVADGRVIELIEAFLKQGILDGLERWSPEKGAPQGAVLSPLLSNIYLDPLDHKMVSAGFEMVRYADDFVILCGSEAEAHRALRIVAEWMKRNGLRLHPEKTRVVDATQHGVGFDFLGYHFEGATRWPRKKSLAKMKAAIRAKTKRCNGHSLERIIHSVNLTLRGWFGYFKHGRWWFFDRIDRWVRMRLRSILRKRRNGRGRGRGADHQRWTNAFFRDHGLFSLMAAYESARQSSRR